MASLPTRGSKHSWRVESNRREFMERLGKELGYKEMKDWYGLSGGDVATNGGFGLLNKYRNSPSLLVRSVFKEHVWSSWRFDRASNAKLLNEKEREELIKWLGEELVIKKLED